MVLKAELMEKTPNRFSHYKKDVGESSNAAVSRSRFSPSDGQGQTRTTNQVQKSSAPISNLAGMHPTAAAAAAAVAATKETPRLVPNPYSRTCGLKCYRCGQPSHHSNECPARKLVNFVDVGEEDEYEQDGEEGAGLEELLDGAKIVEEQGEHVNCVIQ